MGQGSKGVPVGERVRRLLDSEILQKVDQWYAAADAGLLGLAGRFGSQGLLGLGLEFPGREAGPMEEARVFAREIGRLKCVTLSRMLTVQGFYALVPGALVRMGALRDRFFLPASSGLFVVARELRTAGDASLIRRRSLRIERCGDELVLSATGLRVPKADQAAWICLEGSGERTDEAGKISREIMYVPVSSAGVRIAVENSKDGQRHCRVTLHGVRIPAEFSLRLDAATSATLRNFERLFTAELYLSRCEEILAVARDCLRARRVKPATAANAVTGVSRLAELHCEAAAVRALVDGIASPVAGGPAQEIAIARFKVWELARAIRKACPSWWPERSVHRTHPMIELGDDMLEAPLDGAQPSDLLGEIVDALDCRCRLAPAVPADAAAAWLRGLR